MFVLGLMIKYHRGKKVCFLAPSTWFLTVSLSPDSSLLPEGSCHYLLQRNKGKHRDSVLITLEVKDCYLPDTKVAHLDFGEQKSH